MAENLFFSGIKPSKFSINGKRSEFYDVSDVIMNPKYKPTDEELAFFEKTDLVYRTLCAVLYNFAVESGHPGGSISSGRIAQALVFENMAYDFSDPERKDNDLLSYSAGHKALGLYALWALRNEFVRTGSPSMLPEEKFQLRLEDLLGFRKNSVNSTPLFKKFRAKPLDGHPTPATPFVKLATGASGAGFAASIGLGLGAADIFRSDPPRVNIIEGEGGLTAGRVSEAAASAATSRLNNIVAHIDWNQSSIDSDAVCAEDGKPGDYVQWAPEELFYINDWNVISVHNGLDFFQILTAQKLAQAMDTGQPTAVIYRTVKGWKYGLEGKISHGTGHGFSSPGYYGALDEFEKTFGLKMPRYCSARPDPEAVESCFYETLMTIRGALEKDKDLVETAVSKLAEAKKRLEEKKRKERENAPYLEKAYNLEAEPPSELVFKPGAEIAPGEALALCLKHVNDLTRGGLMAASADLYNSTSAALIGKGFGEEGFYNSVSNPGSRLYSAGGICEDAMGGIMSGLSAFSRHIGVTSSYAAFIAPLEHISARLHCIGEQARKDLTAGYPAPFIMINAHYGPKTGEDGPTHADSQPLQLLQENFPAGSLITLTPWEPSEIWPLLAEALFKRPSVIAPFVTRPAEKIPDRKALGLPDPKLAAKGIYPLMKTGKGSARRGTLVIQGAASASVFVGEVLGELKRAGLDLNVFYVTSRELFNLLPEQEKEKLYPEALAFEAMGITDFTLPTLYPWVRSQEGLKRSLYPFKKGRYPGSGKCEKTLEEAGLDAKTQFKAIKDYALKTEKNKTTEVA